MALRLRLGQKLVRRAIADVHEARRAGDGRERRWVFVVDLSRIMIVATPLPRLPRLIVTEMPDAAFDASSTGAFLGKATRPLPSAVASVSAKVAFEERATTHQITGHMLRVQHRVAQTVSKRRSSTHTRPRWFWRGGT